MRHPFHHVVPAAVLAVLVACTSAQRARPAGRSAAIAIVMDGGGVPSAAQVAAVHARVRPDIERLGYGIAENPRRAEVIVHVKFTPDVSGGAGGRVSLLDVTSTTAPHQEAIAAREQFKETSGRAIRSQMTEPR